MSTERMRESKVLLVLQGDGEHWRTSLLLSQDDAQGCLTLLQGGLRATRVDLPSIEGFAELQADQKLLICYNRREIIVVNREVAKNTTAAALELATETDLDHAAHTEVWDWVCERGEPNILDLNADDKLEGILLYRERYCLAVQALDGAIWFAEVSEIYGPVWMGERVILANGTDGLVARPAARQRAY